MAKRLKKKKKTEHIKNMAIKTKLEKKKKIISLVCVSITQQSVEVVMFVDV